MFVNKDFLSQPTKHNAITSPAHAVSRPSSPDGHAHNTTLHTANSPVRNLLYYIDEKCVSQVCAHTHHNRVTRANFVTFSYFFSATWFFSRAAVCPKHSRRGLGAKRARITQHGVQPVSGVRIISLSQNTVRIQRVQSTVDGLPGRRRCRLATARRTQITTCASRPHVFTPMVWRTVSYVGVLDEPTAVHA